MTAVLAEGHNRDMNTSEAQTTAESTSRRDSEGTLIMRGDKVRKLGQHPAVNSYRVLSVSNGIVTLTSDGGYSFNERAKYVTIVDGTY